MEKLLDAVKSAVPGVTDDAVLSAITESGVEPEDYTEAHTNALITRLAGGLAKSTESKALARPKKKQGGAVVGAATNKPTIAAPESPGLTNDVVVKQLQGLYNQGAAVGALGAEAFIAGRQAALNQALASAMASPVSVLPQVGSVELDWDGWQARNPWEATK